MTPVLIACPLALALLAGVGTLRPGGLGGRLRLAEAGSLEGAGIEAPLAVPSVRARTSARESRLRMDGPAAAQGGEPYAPHEVLVQWAGKSRPGLEAGIARAAGAKTLHGEEFPDLAQGEPAVRMQILHLNLRVSVTRAVAYLRAHRAVQWAVPNYIAHEASPRPFVPDDPGRAGTPGGWEKLQWNFAGEFGVNAPQAWANVLADGHGVGRGVIVAVLDTGIAYANHDQYKRSPDLSSSTFVPGYDFIAHNPYPEDRNGHGTFVASTIAEATDNARGLTGLAFGVRLMPVRVLNTAGEGEASAIARGVLFAVHHGARVINMSLEFSRNISAEDIPELVAAMHYAHRRGVVIVAAAGNEGSNLIPYPAHDRYAISVGASTEHGCLATYSNYGHGVALVAPGGGPDANLPGDPNCHPGAAAGRDIYQVTFKGASPDHFGMPGGYEGTSMACPHVAATAALIIASGILGAHPTPTQVEDRMIETARPLGDERDHKDYGAGLLDAAAATEPIKASAARHARAARAATLR